MFEWPDALCPNKETWALESNSYAHTSVLNNSQQIVDHAGDMWQLTMTFDNLLRDKERLYSATVGRLRGLASTVKIKALTRLRTDYIGSPVVVTASVNAFVVLIGGVTMSAKVFSAGDYINIGDQLCEVVEDATSSGTGEVQVKLNRRLRETQAAGTAIEYQNPYCIMRRDNTSFNTSRRPVTASSSISFREAF